VLERVSADSLSTVNSFSTPEAIHIARESIAAGDRFTLDLPKHSVSVIPLSVQPAAGNSAERPHARFE
jgi:alpha-L-arabinofuranosidase